MHPFSLARWDAGATVRASPRSKGPRRGIQTTGSGEKVQALEKVCNVGGMNEDSRENFKLHLYKL